MLTRAGAFAAAAVALARPADAVASLASQPGPVTLQYASFFSGVGAGWNGATQSAFDAALSAAFAPCGATSASCVPLDFPLALGVTLQGVPLSVWTSTPGLQAQVAAALATDAGLNASSSSPAPDSAPGVAASPQPRVVLGGFVESSAGLYLPFVVAGLGPNPGAAAAAAAALFPNGLVSQSSATETALQAAGVHCPLAYAPPERGTPGLGAAPSVGAVLRVSVSFPNATAGSEGVADCLLDNGALVQQLAAQNVELGPIEGGVVLKTHSVVLSSAVGGVRVAPYKSVFVGGDTSTTSEGWVVMHGASSAAPAATGRRLAAAALALAWALC